MIDPQLLAFLQAQPQPTGALDQNPHVQLARNDNIPPTSQYGVSDWDAVAATYSQGGSNLNAMANRHALKPNMMNKGDKRFMMRQIPRLNINDDGGFFSGR